MDQYITIIASTLEEVAPFLQAKSAKEVSHKELYVYATPDNDRVDVIISGCGILPLIYRYTRYLSSFAKPDHVIQVGIAGSFDPIFKIGDVLEVRQEVIMDAGADDADGSFKDMFELGLWHKGAFPFDSDGRMTNDDPMFGHLPQVVGGTSGVASGYMPQLDRLRTHFPQVQVETMEGAPFFYVSLMQKLRFSQVRAVSNQVEARDKSKWDIPLAIKNLNTFLMTNIP